MKTPAKSSDNKISLTGAISMAVGTMIGASIFSIFGIGTQIAGKDLPLAFILSGFYALLVAYTYAKLGGKIISNAGPIAFILKGMGDNVITGALGILMWLSYIVSIALFSKGFTGYFIPLFHIPNTALYIDITETCLILLFMSLNLLGSKAVGKAEFWIVLIKLTILLLFIVVGFFTLKIDRIIPATDSQHLLGVLKASIIFFLSYMGFGLITNASENITNPGRNVPKAIYFSIGIVMVIYVAVAMAAVGNLPIKTLIAAQDNALAIAAKPFLGTFGFILISVGALFSISSALNATLYGGANIAYSLAKDGELPEVFERKVWFKSTEGLYITTALSVVFTLLFNITQIASITSSIFTVIYIFAIISHYRLADEYGGNKKIILINLFILCLVFLALMYSQWESQRFGFYGFIVTLLGAVLLEYVYRQITKREYKTIREFKKRK